MNKLNKFRHTCLCAQTTEPSSFHDPPRLSTLSMRKIWKNRRPRRAEVAKTFPYVPRHRMITLAAITVKSAASAANVQSVSYLTETVHSHHTVNVDEGTNGQCRDAWDNICDNVMFNHRIYKASIFTHICWVRGKIVPTRLIRKTTNVFSSNYTHGRIDHGEFPNNVDNKRHSQEAT